LKISSLSALGMALGRVVGVKGPRARPRPRRADGVAKYWCREDHERQVYFANWPLYWIPSTPALKTFPADNRHA